ncbi:MAG: hypothetical protein WCG27_13155, partial [Pseudomonadota bacterium]
MRKLGILVLIMLSIMTLSVAFWQTVPVLGQRYILKNGMNNKWLHLQVPSSLLLKGGLLELPKTDFSSDNWRLFHFTNFLIPLPVHHPMFMLIPSIMESKDGKELMLGATFIDPQNNEDVASFSSIGKMEMAHPYDEHEIFNLPLFRNWILKKGDPQIWYDLWSMEITPALFSKKLAEVEDYQKLVYQFFILAIRQKYFPAQTEAFNLIISKNMGLLKIKSDYSFMTEIVWLPYEKDNNW